MSSKPTATTHKPTSTRSFVRLVVTCTTIGMVAGLGAAVFLLMLQAGTSIGLGYLANYFPATAGHERTPGYLRFGTLLEGTSVVRWMLLILPAVGGLIGGWVTFTFAPETEGHGTDAAIDAYHFKDGAVRARVPFVKAISSMLTLGTGGSGGREGPIAQIGAGCGSVLGQLLKSPPSERRVLTAAGMAAGIGAIFHAPLAGALFAAEVLYREADFEHEVIVPSFISSIVAYSVFGGIFGFEPLFTTPGFAFDHVAQLLVYGLLAVVLAGAATLFVRMFYGVRHIAFQRATRLPNHFKPAIGGLLVGIIGFFLPEALGAGYGIVQACFSGTVTSLPSVAPLRDLLPGGWEDVHVAVVLLGVIALAKMATTSLTIGSGGSGGVFGPAVVIGGALGGMTGIICAQLFPSLGIQPGAFALVGMAGFFAGAANTPVSTIIMVNEMTGSYKLLIPSMMVCILCYVLCRRATLYREQLPSRLDAPSKIGSMANAVLQQITVREVLDEKPDATPLFVRDETGLPEILARYANSSQECFPVVDGQGRLAGVVDGDDIRRMTQLSGVSDLVIALDIAQPATTITLADSLLSALNSLVRTGLHELVVVASSDKPDVVGTLGRGDIMAAYNRQLRSA